MGVGSRTRASSGGALVSHYARVLWGPFASFENTLNSVANRLYCTPLNVPFQLTIDRIGLCHEGIVAGNMMVGIYRDNGDTPVGGARLGVSAVQAVVANQKNEVPLLSDVILQPGLYWLAACYAMNNTVLYYGRTEPQTGGTLLTYTVNQGALQIPDPCPAVADDPTVPAMYCRVKSVP